MNDFRTALLNAAERELARPARRGPRRRTVLLAVAALSVSSVAAGAASGLFTLTDGSTGELIPLQCKSNADGTITLTMPGESSTIHLPAPHCPTDPGARIVTDAAGRAIKPDAEMGAVGVGGAFSFNVFGVASDGRHVVIATSDPKNLGKTAKELGLPTLGAPSTPSDGVGATGPSPSGGGASVVESGSATVTAQTP